MRLATVLLTILTLSLPALGSADQTFLTKDEALSLILGQNCAIEYEKKELPEDLLEKLDELDVEPEGSPVAHLFRCRRDGKVSGYALIDSQVGKHLPITFIVGITPTGTVSRVEIMVYREEYGSQAHERHYLEQFERKNNTDDIEVGSGIRHVSGATLSSIAIARGVKRNLEIFNYFKLGEVQ